MEFTKYLEENKQYKEEQAKLEELIKNNGSEEAITLQKAQVSKAEFNAIRTWKSEEAMKKGQEQIVNTVLKEQSKSKPIDAQPTQKNTSPILESGFLYDKLEALEKEYDSTEELLKLMEMKESNNIFDKVCNTIDYCIYKVSHSKLWNNVVVDTTKFIISSAVALFFIGVVSSAYDRTVNNELFSPFLGYQSEVVVTESMSPTIEVGDIAIFREINATYDTEFVPKGHQPKTDATHILYEEKIGSLAYYLKYKHSSNSLKVGDIALKEVAAGDGTILVVHRITDIYEEDGKVMVAMKGDREGQAEDAAVEISQIRGLYVAKVPKLGLVTIKLVDLFDGK